MPVNVLPDGVEIPADVDPVKLHAYNLRIGFVPLAHSRRRQRAAPPLPIAEAYELWKRWQEDLEPPAAVYDQLALVAS